MAGRKKGGEVKLNFTQINRIPEYFYIDDEHLTGLWIDNIKDEDDYIDVCTFRWKPSDRIQKDIKMICSKKFFDIINKKNDVDIITNINITDTNIIIDNLKASITKNDHDVAVKSALNLIKINNSNYKVIIKIIIMTMINKTIINKSISYLVWIYLALDRLNLEPNYYIINKLMGFIKGQSLCKFSDLEHKEKIIPSMTNVLKLYLNYSLKFKFSKVFNNTILSLFLSKHFIKDSSCVINIDKLIYNWINRINSYKTKYIDIIWYYSNNNMNGLTDKDMYHDSMNNDNDVISKISEYFGYDNKTVSNILNKHFDVDEPREYDITNYKIKKYNNDDEIIFNIIKDEYYEIVQNKLNDFFLS